MADWLAAIEPGAPEIVSAWRGIEAEQFLGVRREIRRRAGAGSTDRILAELATLADALVSRIASLPAAAFAFPGGEDDWTVAQAVGHVATSRAGLVLAAGLAASGRWPADAPAVVPGVPGPAEATPDDLVRKVVQSQRLIVRTARQIVGHETDPCPLEHPLVGRLRCGEWLFFAGVHDLMHLEQLEGIAARV